jgi:hypothetical protein
MAANINDPFGVPSIPLQEAPWQFLPARPIKHRREAGERLRDGGKRLEIAVRPQLATRVCAIPAAKKLSELVCGHFDIKNNALPTDGESSASLCLAAFF